MTRIAGLVGGLGPESTIDYYRRIQELWRKDKADTAPSLLIDSIDVQHALSLVEHRKPELIAYLMQSVNRLSRGGADFIAMTANTVHIVFDELATRSPVPMLSIVETCADEAVQRRLRRLALLGTKFTMGAPFYPQVFARRGIAVVLPDQRDRDWVHDRYIGELLKGTFKEETRAEFVRLITRLRDEAAVDGIILGGTELPLLLKDSTVAGLPLLDTTELHVAAIVRQLMSNETP